MDSGYDFKMKLFQTEGFSVKFKKYSILMLTTLCISIAIVLAGSYIKSATPIVDIFDVSKTKSDELVQSTGKIGYINQKNLKANCDCIIVDTMAKENTEVKKGEKLFKVAVVELPTNIDIDNISNILNSYKNYDISETEYKIITAPENGTVTSVKANCGDIIRKGSELLTITDKSGLSVKLNINETQISKVKKGQSVKITGNAFEKKTYLGKVLSIADKAEETTTDTGRETTVEVDVRLENPDEEVKLGYTAKCAIVVSSDDNSVIIPYEALGSDSNGDYVYKFQNNRAEKQYITIESELSEGAKVKSGIKGGDRIVKNISKLYDQEIQFIHIESEGAK